MAEIARILIWNLAESKTTLAELRARLPELTGDDRFVSNDAQERFGLISFGEALPDLDELRELLGVEPVVLEEFDVEG